MAGKLTEGFREIIDLKWTDFVEREQSLDATNFDAVITSLIRACAKGNLRAIQTALDRLDGKIATEIEVEYPKFYTLYPRAEKTVDDPAIFDYDESAEKTEKEYRLETAGDPWRQEYLTPETEAIIARGKDIDVVISGAPADLEEMEAQEEDMPTGSLRATLERMLESPKDIVTEIIAAAKSIDNGEVYGNPSVKGVVAAGLMKMVHDGKLSAVMEVFDQIDGKVADTYKVLGDDVYMTNYAMIAPAGAVKNENGVYQIEAENTTNSWVARLEQDNKKRR